MVLGILGSVCTVRPPGQCYKLFREPCCCRNIRYSNFKVWTSELLVIVYHSDLRTVTVYRTQDAKNAQLRNALRAFLSASVISTPFDSRLATLPYSQCLGQCQCWGPRPRVKCVKPGAGNMAWSRISSLSYWVFICANEYVPCSIASL